MSEFSNDRRTNSAEGGYTGEGDDIPPTRPSSFEAGPAETWPRMSQGLRSSVTDVRSVPVVEQQLDGAVSWERGFGGVEPEIPRDDLTTMDVKEPGASDGQTEPGTYRPSTALDSSFRRLNDCLKGELAAVEAYDLALESARDPDLRAPLRELRDSHKRRVKMLAQKVRNWNGEPTERSGAWGAFARAVQRAADLFGDRAALAALAQGEEHGILRYEQDLEGLDPATRDYLEVQLLPLQRESLAFCRELSRRRRVA